MAKLDFFNALSGFGLGGCSSRNSLRQHRCRDVRYPNFCEKLSNHEEGVFGPRRLIEIFGKLFKILNSESGCNTPTAYSGRNDGGKPGRQHEAERAHEAGVVAERRGEDRRQR
jgi:hypothetical protein